MRKTGNAQDAKITAIMGASGCGKSFYIRQRLASQPRTRTLIWSPKERVDQYVKVFPGSVTCRTVAEVFAILSAAGGEGGSGPFHIVYVPRFNRKIDVAQFNAVCKIALAAQNLTVVVEELHTVTTAQWSPDGWSELVMMGRGLGVEIFGVSQRPASVDKDFLGNVSLIHVGRLPYDDDARAVAKALRVDHNVVMDLSGYQWIERDTLTGKVTFSAPLAK